MLKRTLFYPKALTGQGTADVQALRSYIEHLAFAHHMKPRSLLELLVEQAPRAGRQSFPREFARMRIHGHASLSKDLQDRLEAATGVSLAGSNLLRFTNVLAPTNLTRDDTLYCPCCVAEGDDMPYIRLLWKLQCVTACPVHRVKLRSSDHCGAAASDKLPVHKRPAIGGVCAQCGSLGFKCITAPAEAASPQEVWVATQAARLLATPVDSTFELADLQSGLKELVDRTYDGSVVAASLSSGLARASVHSWVAGARPGLPWLLQLCMHAGADPVALLGGSFVALPDQALSGRQYEVLPRDYKFAATDDATIRQRLTEASQAAEPPSIREFARECGIHVDTPRQRFPAEVTLLAAARKSYVERLNEERYQAAVQAYRAAAKALAAEGMTIHIKRVQERSGLVAFSQHRSRVRALRTVMAEFRPKEEEEAGQGATRRKGSVSALAPNPC